jgi:monoamine oxidase
MTKVAAVYDRPFWRDKGLTGTAVNADGFVSATFDDSPPSGRPGVVFGFVGGDQARTFNRMAAADRRRTVLAEYQQFFGPEAGSPRDYHASGTLRVVERYGTFLDANGNARLAPRGTVICTSGTVRWTAR